MDVRHYAVLEALSTGVKTAEELAGEVDMEPHEVEIILNALLAQGLVERRERGLLFKREAYGISEKGWHALTQWREEVKKAVEKAAELRREGRDEEADRLLAPLQPVIPFLLASGVIEMALWSAALGQLLGGLEEGEGGDSLEL
ncbi:MAG: transcriptional regulator [Pyrobaculum sp.]